MLDRLRAGLARTRNRMANGLRRLSGDRSLEDAIETLEELLYTADVGGLASEILEGIEQEMRSGALASTSQIPASLRRRLRGFLTDGGPLARAADGPTVLLLAGVNGVGKTTSIAKLARWLQSQGHSVLVAAGDTFRAAAVEQLGIWCERLQVDLIRGAENADPASVAHDAIAAAESRDVDYLLVDTAGRLHTQDDLMAELNKVVRVMAKSRPDCPHEVLLVLDATTGQNAIQQARKFGESVKATGVILAKLDGTAKGGAVFAIGRELGLPVKFVGLGEQLDDLEPFDAEQFLDALLQETEADAT